MSSASRADGVRAADGSASGRLSYQTHVVQLALDKGDDDRGRDTIVPVAIFYEEVLRALDGASIRFVLVGGVAVILHGVPRTTADLDLVIDLDEANVRRFVEVMARLGFVPRAPVAAADLASADRRRAWIADRHMVAFSFHRPGRPLDEVDVLIDSPLPYAELAAGADLVEAEGIRLPIVGIRDLIRMKERAGRAQDVADADALRRLVEGGSGA